MMKKLRIGLVVLLFLVFAGKIGAQHYEVGRIDLQRAAPRGDDSWITDLEVSGFRPGASVLPHNTTCDQYGRFLFWLPSGEWKVSVKSQHSLGTIRPIQGRVSGDTGFGLLLEGDANNDNVIDDLDFAILTDVYWTDSPLADFNQDGQVNALDFSLLNSNYGRKGPICYTYLAQVSK